MLHKTTRSTSGRWQAWENLWKTYEIYKILCKSGLASVLVNWTVRAVHTECGRLVAVVGTEEPALMSMIYTDTIRYDTIAEFNVDSKAEYTAQSSTRSQQLKQSSAPLPDVAVL